MNCQSSCGAAAIRRARSTELLFQGVNGIPDRSEKVKAASLSTSGRAAAVRRARSTEVTA